MNRFLTCVLTLLLACGVAQAATVAVSPTSAPAGAGIVTSFDGLTVGSNYRLRLERGQPAVQSFVLKEFQAADTEYAARLSLPDEAVDGPHFLVLYSYGLLTAEVGRTAFSIAPALAVALSPTSAEPGKSVAVTVTGARAGSISLDYAGTRILGPVSTAEGIWRGKFIVPRDRPASIPASVKVVASNTIGKLTTTKGVATFSVLAPSGLPTFRSSFVEPPPVNPREGSRIDFAGRLQQPDGKGTEGRTSFFWKGPNGRVVPLDGGVTSDADGNYFAPARAPSFYMDGIGQAASGDVLAVVSDTDPDTDRPRDFVASTGLTLTSTHFQPGAGQFVIRLQGKNAIGQDIPIEGAYVAVDDSQLPAFSDAHDGIPPPGAQDFLIADSQFTADIVGSGLPGNFFAGSGCPINFGAGYSNEVGEVAFELDPEKLKHLQALDAMKALGEIRTIDVGAPVPGVDVFDQVGNGGGQFKGAVASDEEVRLAVTIYAGYKGYGETGQCDVDGNPDPGLPGQTLVPCFRPTVATLAINLESGEIRLDGPVGQFGSTNGSITSPGVITVNLERIPTSTTANIVPYEVRIENLAPPVLSFGFQTFRGMDSFPDPAKWPDSVFTVRNAGRKIRFNWNAAFGVAGNPNLRLNLPDGPRDIPFATDTQTTCVLAGEDPLGTVATYVATLPDLTRLPVPVPGASGVSPEKCFIGEITVPRGGLTARQEIKLCTRRPPDDMSALNPDFLPGDLRINAFTGAYDAQLNLPSTQADVDDPKMREYDLPPQKNESLNEGSISYGTNYLGQRAETSSASTGHELSNELTAPTPVQNLGLFGFDDNRRDSSHIQRTEVLDTGNITLFRYPWGFSPIAGAILGADFWLGADVAFYGQLGGLEGSDNPMDATIDPRVRGGIDLFFDLRVLGGLISAHISALPQIELTLREVIGAGGLANQQSGVCANFVLDAALEICGVWVFCYSDEFNLFAADTPNGCATPLKATTPRDFDLSPPRVAPAAIAASGYGSKLALRVDANQRLLAEHMEANLRPTTRVVSPATHGVQQIALTYLDSERALAVWSESRLTTAAIRALMTPTLANPNPVRTNTAELTRNLGLRYSVFDGSTWSAPDWVPGVQAGSVGLPALAVCKSTFLLGGGACSRGGAAAYLVWQHDAAGNINRADMEIWGLRYTSASGFGTPTRLSAANGSQDIQPDVAFLGTQPIVAWTTSSAGLYGDPSTRRIAYRIVDATVPTNPVKVLDDSRGAGWATVATQGSSKVLFAFTRAQDNSLIGNRNALAVAGGTCVAGSCSAPVTEPRDPAGRQIRGEAPSVAFGENGEAVVQLRALAFGPNASGQTVSLPSDSPGTLLGTGDLMELRVSRFSSATTTVATRNLSADGLMHFQPQFVFDPAIDGFIGINHEVQAPIAKSESLDYAKRILPYGFTPTSRAKALGDDGLMLYTATPAPDFRIEAVTLDQPFLSPGQSANFSVRVRNAGVSYDPATHGTTQLRLSWDAPPGAGVAASADVNLATALASNGVRTFTGSVSAPAQHFADQRRTLYVEVQTAAATPDAITDDNLFAITLGDMPVPQGLLARTKPDLAGIGLDWATASDPRVAGYRVYRRAENGKFVPYGSSNASGYVDVFAGFRNVEEYAVTSYSGRGIESAMSAPVTVVPTQTSGIFSDNFEAKF